MLFNLTITILFVLIFISCKKKTIKDIEFSFEPHSNVSSQYMYNPVYCNLTVFSKNENTIFLNCFKGNLLKDGHKYYLLYPEIAWCEELEDNDIIWYYFLFFDSSLRTNEVVEFNKYLRLDRNDTLNFIKQKLLLKMERIIIVNNEVFYIFSQSFGSDNFMSGLMIKYLAYYQKHLEFVRFYFLFSKNTGFIYLPYMVNRSLMYGNRIPYSKDNHWMYGDTTMYQLIN